MMVNSPLPPLNKGEDTKHVLRLSVTDRCNLRCRYCLPQGLINSIPVSQLPSLERLVEAVRRLCEIFSISKIKLTGGEPLARKGLVDLVGRIAAIPGLEDLSMTTNATRLADHAVELRRAGLRRVNVSLDSMNPMNFRELTGGRLEDTLAGIQAAKEAGLAPIKINAVLRASSWREDVPQLLDFAAEGDYPLRFIELMETGAAAAWARSEFVSAHEVRAWLEDHATVTPRQDSGPGPARGTTVIWNGKELFMGWITPQSQRFCDGCNRLRLDSRGRLRRCLMDRLYFPLLDCLDSLPSSRVEALVRGYVAGKQPPVEMSLPGDMVAVGG